MNVLTSDIINWGLAALDNKLWSRKRGYHRRWEKSQWSFEYVPLTRRQRKARDKANQGNWGEAHVLALRYVSALEKEIR